MHAWSFIRVGRGNRAAAPGDFQPETVAAEDEEIRGHAPACFAETPIS